jgi:hypothetical protein
VKTIREHKIRSNIAKEKKHLAEIKQDELKLCFNIFLRSISTKNRWFQRNKHPNDPLIRVENLSEQETSNFLLDSIAKIVHLFLFNKHTVFEEKIEERVIKIDLLTVEGLNNKFLLLNLYNVLLLILNKLRDPYLSV